MAGIPGVERQRGSKRICDTDLVGVECWEYRVKWPGRNEEEGRVCRETRNWAPLPLPLH